MAKDRDGKVEKATQDERMALGACCSWLDFERWLFLALYNQESVRVFFDLQVENVPQHDSQ